MKALLNIDYTYDFVATDGKLTTGSAGQAIEKELFTLTEDFLKAGDFVVLAIDGHDPKDNCHPENKLFPPHNVLNTAGRDLYGNLKTLYENQKDDFYYLDKRHYSAFCGTDLDLRLRERKITEVHLVGVCTDICILHTAVDAYNLGYDLVIYENAVASFDPVGHKWALNHFKNTLGATLR